MSRRFCSLQQLAICLLKLGCGAALAVVTSQLGAQNLPPAKVAVSLDWDATFADRSHNHPLHFIAEYTDPSGPHRLEEWRTGVTHLRRRTDDRIDLHADAMAPTGAGRTASSRVVDYLWQIVDVQKKIDNKIGSQTMFQAGLFYSYYSMAHVISRPAGRFRLSRLPDEPAKSVLGHTCTWYKVVAEGQSGTLICWSPELAIPLETRAYSTAGAVTSSFQVRSLDEKAIPHGVFTVRLAGLTIHDHDQMTDVD